MTGTEGIAAAGAGGSSGNVRKTLPLRLNLGCGHQHMTGWLNVDSQAGCKPDMVVDLERLPWPWPDNSVAEVILSHVLEHLGERRDDFLGIVRELYRVCAPGARIHISVPHPRHDHFTADPTHVRPITPTMLDVFDQAQNREWIAKGYANTPLGVYLGVDFRIRDHRYRLAPPYAARLADGSLSQEAVSQLIATRYNICEEIYIEWEAVKGG